MSLRGTLGAGAILGLLAWRYRLGIALAAAVLCAAPGFVPFLPVTQGQWGATLVGTGFVALATGILFNWWSSRTGYHAGLEWLEHPDRRDS